MTALNHDDIRWRVSNTWDKGSTKMGMLVGYIDSRTAMEALDALDPSWSSKMEPVSLGGEQGIRCTLIVNGVSREDVGVASNTEPLKGAFSDALKRAAVHFGIGRELYELPKIAVECEVDQRTGKAKAPKALPRFKNGRWEIDRQYGWVRYDREPDEQAGRAQPNIRDLDPRGDTPVPPQRSAEEQKLRDELLALTAEKGHAYQEALADRVGVQKGTRATAEQLREMIHLAVDQTAIETTAPPLAVEEEASAEPAPVADAPPPKPGTPEYGALKPHEKASARAYWANPPEEPSLAEQLTVPA